MKAGLFLRRKAAGWAEPPKPDDAASCLAVDTNAQHLSLGFISVGIGRGGGGL